MANPGPPSPPWWFLHDLLAPDEGHGPGTHLSNLGIAALLFETRNRYFARLAVPGGIWEGPVVPLMRELLIHYEGEVSVGTRLQGAVAVTARSRRALTMTERLVDVTSGDPPRLVASARSVHVTVDREAGRTAEVPESLLAAVEALQGYPVPWPDAPSAEHVRPV